MLGTTERLTRAATTGGKKQQTPVPSLHILDDTGTVWVRMFEPARPPQVTEVQGQTA